MGSGALELCLIRPKNQGVVSAHRGLLPHRRVCDVEVCILDEGTEKKRSLCARSLIPLCGVGGVDLVGLSEQRESFGGTPSLTSPVGPSGRACCSTPSPHYQLFLLFKFLFFFLFSRYLLLYTSLVRITNNLVFLFTCSFFFLFSFFPVICSFLFLLELPESVICKNQ